MGGAWEEKVRVIAEADIDEQINEELEAEKPSDSFDAAELVDGNAVLELEDVGIFEEGRDDETEREGAEVAELSKWAAENVESESGLDLGSGNF